MHLAQLKPQTRFAPSPTGPMHLGHALCALWSHARAQQLDGAFLVRIEDIDDTRRRPEHIADIHKMLALLELEVDAPIVTQHDRRALYDGALTELKKLDVVYPCTCTRAEIAAATPAGHPAHTYPGTCRNKQRGITKLSAIANASPVAWRLDWQRLAKTFPSEALDFTDLRLGLQRGAMDAWGDVVIARKDIGTSYHLAHVVDDHLQAITHVTRGLDLLDQTPIHRVLQTLLGYACPLYDHHPLVMEAPTSTQKLSKRNGSTSLTAMMDGASGLTLDQVKARLAPYLGQM